MYIKKIIFLAKLLVTTGQVLDKNATSRISEVLDLSDPKNKCQMLQEYPVEVMKATGKLIDGELPLICGGIGMKTMFSVPVKNAPVKSISTLPRGNCGKNEFECNSGQPDCIPIRLYCDGILADCLDGSDESPSECGNISILQKVTNTVI